jgi:hypothetical protein
MEQFGNLTEDEAQAAGAVNAKKILDAKNTAYAAMLTAGSDESVARSFIGMVAAIGAITVPTLETAKFRIDAAYTFYGGMSPSQLSVSGVYNAYLELNEKNELYQSVKESNDNYLAAAGFAAAVKAVRLNFDSEPELIALNQMYQALTPVQKAMFEVVEAYKELNRLYTRFTELLPALRDFLDKVALLESKTVTPTASFFRNIKLLKDEYGGYDAEAREFVAAGYDRIIAVESRFYELADIKTSYDVVYTAFNENERLYSATASAVLDVGSYFSLPYEDLPSMDKSVYVDGVRLKPNGTLYKVENAVSVTNQPFGAGGSASVLTREIKFVLADAEFTAEIKIRPPLSPVTAVEWGDTQYHLHDSTDTAGTDITKDFVFPAGSSKNGSFSAPALPYDSYDDNFRKFRVLIYPENVNADKLPTSVPFTSYEITERYSHPEDANLTSFGGQSATAQLQVNIQRVKSALAGAGFYGNMNVRLAVQSVSTSDSYSDGFLYGKSLSKGTLSLNVSAADAGAPKLPSFTGLINLERIGHLQILRGIRLEGLPAMYHPEFDSLKIYVFKPGESRREPQYALGYLRIQSVKTQSAWSSEPEVRYWSFVKGGDESPEEIIGTDELYGGWGPNKNKRFNMWVHFEDLKRAVGSRILQKSGMGYNDNFKLAVQMCAVPGSSFSDSDLSAFTPDYKIDFNENISTWERDGDFWKGGVTVIPA